jgi:hypothetical protein
MLVPSSTQYFTHKILLWWSLWSSSLWTEPTNNWITSWPFHIPSKELIDILDEKDLFEFWILCQESWLVTLHMHTKFLDLIIYCRLQSCHWSEILPFTQSLLGSGAVSNANITVHSTCRDLANCLQWRQNFISVTIMLNYDHWWVLDRSHPSLGQVWPMAII